MDFFDKSNNRASTDAYLSLLSNALNTTDGSNILRQHAMNKNNGKEAPVAPQQNNQNTNGYLFDQSKSRTLTPSHITPILFLYQQHQQQQQHP